MKAKTIIFPHEDGFHVLVWGAWTEGSMRIHSFDDRISMIALLENLRLILPEEARDLNDFNFLNSCPIYSSEIDEEMLDAHGFRRA